MAINIYKSDQPIWWNRGNEVKPNWADFQTITWSQLHNFNINYLNELQIQFTMAANDEFDLIKIEIVNEINRPDETTFWYLENIQSKNAKNQRVIFTLDLWTTFILNKKINLQYLQTNRTHLTRWDFKGDFNEFTNPEPYGLVTNIYDYNKIKTQTLPVNFDFELNNIFQPDNGMPAIPQEPFKYSNLIKYYIFKYKSTNNINNEKHIIAIPQLLNQSYRDLNFTDRIDKIPYNKIFYKGITPFNFNKIDFFILNEQRILDKLIDTKSDYPVSDLGDFIGIFYGPNFWRIQHDQSYEIFWNNKKYDIRDIVPLSIENGNNNPFIMKIRGLICIRIKASGNTLLKLNLQDPNLEQCLKNGLNIFNDLENTIQWLTAEKIYFTNKFILNNRNKTTETFTEIPSFYDAYFDWLAQTKAQRENQLNVAKQQMIMGLSKNVLNLLTFGAANAFNFGGGDNSNSSIAGGIAKGFSSIVGSTFGVAQNILQYQNTLKSIAATKTDARTKISNELIGADAKFLKQHFLLSEIVDPDPKKIANIANMFDNRQENWNNEILYGIKFNDVLNSYNFWGWETNFKTFNNYNIQAINSGYLKFNENINSTFLNSFNLTPTIRQGILTLLINGVRIATKNEINNNFA